MSKLQFYGAMCIAVVIIGVLLVLYIYEVCRRKNAQNRLDSEARACQKAVDDMAGIYERLFPKKLLELLGIRKMEDISTELTRTFPASVMSVNTLDYTRAIHTMSAKELFEAMNKIFAGIIPLIAGSGGIIDKFEKAGMTGLYPDSGENALTTAISLCAAVDEMGRTDACGELAVGLDYGEVMMGIAGCKDRISAVAMSENISISEILREKAAAYGARILATGNFTAHVQDFGKNYNSRFLGYFYDSSRKNMIEVYDIYDGDMPERKQGKRRTKMIFEQGVERFIHGSYMEARLHFVEVLKADRYDLAAREYLYLCDTYVSRKPGFGEIFIVSF